VLVASGAPLDQYVITHPRFVFEQPPEHALINPDNLMILVNHLRCAAYELPFERGEPFGEFEDASAVLDLLAEQGEVYASGNAYRWVSDTYPAAEFGLQTSSLDTIIIQDHTGETPQVIGEVVRRPAPILVHEGGRYLHEGAEYVTGRLDWEQGLAIARQTAVDYYSDASA